MPAQRTKKISLYETMERSNKRGHASDMFLQLYFNVGTITCIFVCFGLLMDGHTLAIPIVIVFFVCSVLGWLAAIRHKFQGTEPRPSERR